MCRGTEEGSSLYQGFDLVNVLVEGELKGQKCTSEALILRSNGACPEASYLFQITLCLSQC